MKAIRSDLPGSKRLLFKGAPWRNAVWQRGLSYARPLISFVLLLSFLSSIVLPSQYQEQAKPAGHQTTVCALQVPETILDYLVDNCLEPNQNAPDEESD